MKPIHVHVVNLALMYTLSVIKPDCDVIKPDCDVIKPDCDVIKPDCDVIKPDCDVIKLVCLIIKVWPNYMLGSLRLVMEVMCLG